MPKRDDRLWLRSRCRSQPWWCLVATANDRVADLRSRDRASSRVELDAAADVERELRPIPVEYRRGQRAFADGSLVPLATYPIVRQVCHSRPRFQERAPPFTARANLQAHEAKRGSWTDQRPARDNTIHNPVKSAKPPSPVQIRAAPPNFPVQIRSFCAPVAQTDASPMDCSGLQALRRRCVAFRNVLTATPLAVRASKREEVSRTSALSRVVMVSHSPSGGADLLRLRAEDG